MAEHDEQNVHQVWSDDELDQALSALNSEVLTDERVLSRTRAELIVAAGGQPQPSQSSQPPQLSIEDSAIRRWHWGWWAVAAAAVVVLVAGALVIQTVSFNGSPPAASAAAAALNSAADKIGASDPPLRPGQYRYISSHAWSMTTFAGSSGEKSFSYLEEHLAEEWVPADQTQEWLLRSHPTGNRKWIDGSEEEARAAGLPVDETTRPADELRARCGDYYPDQGKQPCERAAGRARLRSSSPRSRPIHASCTSGCGWTPRTGGRIRTWRCWSTRRMRCAAVACRPTSGPTCTAR